MYCVIIMNTVDGTVDATVASANVHKKEGWLYADKIHENGGCQQINRRNHWWNI